ncbi:MAG: N-acetyltransferase family protein [Cyclobacteriaceae bacterium]
MSENINVRPGNQADLPQVLELIKELAEFTGYLDQVKTTVEQMEIDGFGEKPVFEFLVATRGEDIIGTSIYYYRYSTWKGRRLYLEGLSRKRKREEQRYRQAFIQRYDEAGIG